MDAQEKKEMQIGLMLLELTKERLEKELQTITEKIEDLKKELCKEETT